MLGSAHLTYWSDFPRAFPRRFREAIGVGTTATGGAIVKA